MNSRELHVISHVIRVVFIVLTIFVGSAFGQIYHVKDMNTEQIKALDREKTVVLLPVGILEEHGPYLPSFSDGYMAERRTHDLANAIVGRPGWKVLIFPLIPLGTGPANIVGRKYVFPGSYTVRPSTLSLDLHYEFASKPEPEPRSQSGGRLLSRRLRRTHD